MSCLYLTADEQTGATISNEAWPRNSEFIQNIKTLAWSSEPVKFGISSEKQRHGRHKSMELVSQFSSKGK